MKNTNLILTWAQILHAFDNQDVGNVKTHANAKRGRTT